MFKRILVALDGSSTAESILPAVISLAKLYGSWVTLCSIIPHQKTGQLFSKQYFLEKIELDSQAKLNLYLHEWESKLNSIGIRTDILIKTGNPPQEIIRLTEDSHYDLLALATRGRSGIMRWILGSVADHIIGSVPIPILLIAPHENVKYSFKQPIKLNSIIIPLDGSKLAESVLPVAESIALKSSAEITLIQAVPTVIQVYLGIEPQTYPIDILENLEERGNDYLSKVKRFLVNRGTKVESKLLEGDASSSIINFCSQIDHSLVTMTTRGNTGFSRWVLGSVADKIIRNIGGPVLLIKI